MVLFCIVSCSGINTITRDYSFLGESTEIDYINHLSSAGADYLSYKETREIKLNKDSLEYLTAIYERLMINNELLLLQNAKPSFHVVANRTPFIFSLPGAQFFISNGLIGKYLTSEELFVAALAAEVLKSNRNIYEKKIMLPLGFYNTEKIIELTRLKLETKYQVNEWTYYILKRAGFDPSAYLNWIQVQNRNTLDFSVYRGDSATISKEEYYFKNFMSKQGNLGFERKINEANSSKPFYKLLKNIESNQ